MRQTVLNGLVLTLGESKCYGCTRPDDFPGKRLGFPSVDCVKCRGTGRRGNGKCRACNGYNPAGPGKRLDHDNPYVIGDCETCHGTSVRPATMTDALPGEVMRQIIDATGGLRLHLRGADLTWGESHLGMVHPDTGLYALWSSVDYGRTWDRLAEANAEGRLTEEVAAFKAEIAEKVAADRVQACKVATDDGVICLAIVILAARNGYTVAGIARPEADRAEALAAEDARIIAAMAAEGSSA